MINTSDVVQFGMAGAVIVVVAMFLWFLTHERKIWIAALNANTQVLNKILVQLGKSG